MSLSSIYHPLSLAGRYHAFWQVEISVTGVVSVAECEGDSSCCKLRGSGIIGLPSCFYHS